MPDAPDHKLDPGTVDPLKEPLVAGPGSALTAKDADVTGFGLSEQAARIREDRAAGIKREQEAAEEGFFGALGTAFQEGTTAHILRAMQNSRDRDWADFDIDFDVRAGATMAAEAYGFPLDEDALRVLSQAGTEEDMLERARLYKQHLNNLETINRHGGAAILAGILDPVWLLADTASFGATRIGRMGRAASGLTMASVALGVTAAGDAAGQETSGFDYILNAALLGGAGVLFGGTRAAKIAAGEATDLTPAGAITPVTAPREGASGLAKIRQNVNEFTSEFDRLAMPTRSGAAERAEIIGRLADDPLIRPEFMKATPATSWLRTVRNQADAHLIEYHDAVDAALKRRGLNAWQRKVDTSGAASTARDALERRVAEEIIQRDEVWRRTGERFQGEDPEVAQIADRLEALHNRVGEIARESGLRGFEDFTPRPGYFHRSWNAAAVTRHDPDVVRGLIAQSVLRGMPKVGEETADLIARSIVDRAAARLRNDGLDFFGSIGKTDTDMIEEMLKGTSGVSAARVESVMRRLRQNLDEAGTVKYGKGRLPLDMTTQITMPDGSTLGMLDLIDTDLGRLAENYTTSMTGRSALAKAGIGGDEQALNELRRQYADTLKGMPETLRRDRMLALEGLIGDFTGTRPDQNVLGQGAQRLKTLADSSMLAASGLWQVTQYAEMGVQYGIAQTTKEFFKAFPGSRLLMNKIAKDPDLSDEMRTVLGVDLARDIRWHPWVRQHDVNLASKDTALDRILHAGKQATPYLNMMRFVHTQQSRMNANLAMNTIARAARGEAKAVKILQEYGLTGDPLKRILETARRTVTYQGKNAKQMNWGAWPGNIRDDALNVALRMMDDAIVYGRPGQSIGSPLMARSQVGQILGQFRNWVGVAHNKLLRGTLSRRGWGGLAGLLVFQYPMTYMMVALNEIRAGRLDDISPEKVAARAFGYVSGLGLASEAISIVGLSGGRGGLSVPITGTFDAIPHAVGGLGKLGTGDFRGGTADLMKAATAALPAVGILPGTAWAINAVRGD